MGLPADRRRASGAAGRRVHDRGLEFRIPGVGRGVNTDDLNLYSTWMIHFNRLASGQVVVDMFVVDVECRYPATQGGVAFGPPRLVDVTGRGSPESNNGSRASSDFPCGAPHTFVASLVASNFDGVAIQVKRILKNPP